MRRWSCTTQSVHVPVIAPAAIGDRGAAHAHKVRTVEMWPIIRGLMTYVIDPSSRLRSLVAPPAAPGRASSAEYCYGVWAKHLALLCEQGMRAPPLRVAEFGPGESLGVGVAALLMGTRAYGAFDVDRFADTSRNLALLDELAAMLARRAPVARAHSAWPPFQQLLDKEGFPGAQIPDAALTAALDADRVAATRAALAHLDDPQQKSETIQYRAPWYEHLEAPQEPYDLILSHSVLQYVEDLPQFLAVCAKWLKPGGWMSHHIDMTSMRITREWNGHWSYPEWLWKVVRGNRPFFATRRICSEYLEAFQSSGFRIVKAHRKYADHGISRAAAAADRSHLSDDDFSCTTLFLIGRNS